MSCSQWCAWRHGEIHTEMYKKTYSSVSVSVYATHLQQISIYTCTSLLISLRYPLLLEKTLTESTLKVINSKLHHYVLCPQTSHQRHPTHNKITLWPFMVQTTCRKKKTICMHNTVLCWPDHRAPLLFHGLYSSHHTVISPSLGGVSLHLVSLISSPLNHHILHTHTINSSKSIIANSIWNMICMHGLRVKSSVISDQSDR